MAIQNVSAKQGLVYIDDSADDQFLFRKAVARNGIPLRVESFSSHLPAIDYLLGEFPFDDRTAHPFPVMLICDYDLGLQKGSEVVAIIRTLPKCAGLPIIVFSGRNAPSAVAESYAAGASCFLGKPSEANRWDVLVRALFEGVDGAAGTLEALNALPECSRRPDSGAAAEQRV